MYHVYTLLLQLILFILTNITTNNKNNFASYNTKIKLNVKPKCCLNLEQQTSEFVKRLKKQNGFTIRYLNFKFIKQQNHFYIPNNINKC